MIRGTQARHIGSIDRLLIAVPARDEEASIDECVHSIVEACEAAGLPFQVHVAADSCTDGTVAKLDALRNVHDELRVALGDWGNAGAARRAAVDSFLGTERSCRWSPSSTWLANTDADCIVPRDWITSQLRYASWCDAVAGIIDLDQGQVSPLVYRRFVATYQKDGDTHPHVHGANLGVRLSAYLAAGGWSNELEVGEDHRLWQDLHRSGSILWPSTQVRVVTSARTHGRVEGGFATNIRTLERGGTVPAPAERAIAR